MKTIFTRLTTAKPAGIFILLIATLISSHTIWAQCTPANKSSAYLKLDFVKDFCADPAGKKNAYPALVNAAKFITERGGNCSLYFPAGQYLIHSQQEALSVFAVFPLYNCRKVTLYGAPGGKSKLMYAPGQWYGGFDQNRKPQAGSSVAVKATPGNLFYFSNCSDITVRQLDMDGNSGLLKVGGYTSTHSGKLMAYQLPHSGIAIWNRCSQILIEQVNVHHFALDGIMLNPDKAKPQQITMRNSSFDYNGRQGLSWSGGDGLFVENCSFSHTGRGKIQDPPMSGVDIEPNGGIGKECTQGRFSRCRMINNVGYALQNPYSKDMLSENVRFDSCLFHDNDASQIGGDLTACVMVRGKSFTFNECKIWGGFFYGHDAASAEDATRFFRCDFADESLNGQFTPLPFLIYSEQHTNFMQFDQCTFRVIHPNKRFAHLINFNLNRPDTYARLRDCTFTYAPTHTSGWNQTSVFKACAFEGQTRFINQAPVSQSAASIKWIETAALWFRGSRKADQPDRCVVGHQIQWTHLSSVNKGKTKDFFSLGNAGEQEHVQLVLQENAALHMKAGTLQIYSGASLEIQKNGLLYAPGTRVELQGKLTLSAGAGFMLEEATVKQTAGGRLYVDRKAVALKGKQAPFNLTPSAGSARIKPEGPLHIEGQHADFRSFPNR